MHKARAFFYVCAGIFLLALAYNFGAVSATAQVPGNPVPSMPQVATEPPGEPSPEILKACRRISPESLLRVRGDFGQFQGYASQVGPLGLDGLRAHPTDGAFAYPPGLVTWDRIERIEKRVGSSGNGALFGAVLVGIIGYALAEALGSNSGDAARGAAVGGAVGAGLGGLIGAAIPRRHLAYGHLAYAGP